MVPFSTLSLTDDELLQIVKYADLGIWLDILKSNGL